MGLDMVLGWITGGASHLFKFILKFWREAMIVSLLMLVNNFNDTISEQKADLAVVENNLGKRTVELKAATDSLKTLNQIIIEQNANVKRMEDLAEKQEDLLAKKLAEINTISNESAIIIANIMEESVGNTCNDSINWLIDKSQELVK